MQVPRLHTKIDLEKIEKKVILKALRSAEVLIGARPNGHAAGAYVDDAALDHSALGFHLSCRAERRSRKCSVFRHHDRSAEEYKAGLLG